MLCPANILGYLFTIRLVSQAPHVEWGRLLPLSAVRSCPGVLPAFSKRGTAEAAPAKTFSSSGHDTSRPANILGYLLAIAQ